ncbi:MAG: hypothetical protein K2H89_08635 [Oscillospiraceae bacterium]|nr:hypothetical protein [Oscillospiraceae bacterium]
MTILFIVVVFFACWLIGKILQKLTEFWADQGIKKSVAREKRKLERYHKEHEIEEEKRVRPHVKKYENSPFLKLVVDNILDQSQGGVISYIKITKWTLDFDVHKCDNEDYSIFDDKGLPIYSSIHIKFNDLGYQSISDDNHLEGFAKALNLRLGGRY